MNLPFNTSILRINHHLTHACSSYYNSGFDESAVLVIDGCGDNYIHKKVETISCGYASGKKINIFETIQGDIKSIFSDDSNPLGMVNNSLGEMYTLITLCCGFDRFSEGKIMGLAPYGCDKYVQEIDQYVKVSTDEKNRVDVKVNTHELYTWGNKIIQKDDSFENKANLAYAAQAVL